ncbi:DUF4097 family beta strand repeat-containing protein [Dyella sp. A6]|uniref:DUF4097 family beta strand repeat-containing protein n=1 Tax=Dyella aluminiiresistens TaxID=3069105 RepID=UPI002E766C53|nr:DUF4097 family beta strand repeat-containing protein [Dyella sp. A6]
MKTARHLTLLLFLAATPALADTPIQLQHAASPSVHVSISNTVGDVHVTGWDRNEVQVTGDLGNGARPLAITGDDSHLEIKVQPKGGGGWFNWNSSNSMGSTTLDVHVPVGASLHVNVVSSSAAIDGLRGGSIKLDSISGRVRIDARTPSLEVDSVSGGVTFSGHADHADLQTVSGDIVAPSIGLDASLQTVSGHIQAGGGPWKQFKLSTVSGDANVNGSMAPDGQIDIDSMSGDIDLRLPTDLSSTIHASTFSGDLHSDFGTPKTSQHGPGSSLVVTVGQGNGSVKAETFSGDLRIHKQN